MSDTLEILEATKMISIKQSKRMIRNQKYLILNKCGKQNQISNVSVTQIQELIIVTVTNIYMWDFKKDWDCIFIVF